ncbi:Purine-binding protein [Alcanivorax sp. ALC70]|nr:Purine-binding protein [Alcanivorax sp. ALC70]
MLVETAEKRGVMTCGYHASQAALAPEGYLTGAEWNWVTPYKKHVQAAQAGEPMINFLRGGLKEGFVKTSPYGPKVSAEAKKNADAVKAEMMAGDFVIFGGPLKNNGGEIVIPDGTDYKQTAVELERMDYLVEGVRGQI